MNKREFVCAAGGALLATGGAVQASSGPAGSALAAPGASALDWQSRLGERFELVGQHGPGALQLQRVDLRPSYPGTEQFSLVFSASAVVPGGTHVLRHAQQGLLALMLCDAGRQAPDQALPGRQDPDQALPGRQAPDQALVRADCCRLVQRPCASPA